MISGRVKVKRPNEPGKVERLVKWDAAIGIATKMLKSRIGSVPQSPYAALDLMKAAKSGTRAEGFQREDEVLADLIAGDQLQASVYAFNLVQKRTKRPAGAPDKELAKKVTKVGVHRRRATWRASSPCSSCAACACPWSSPTSTRSASTRAWPTSPARSTRCSRRAASPPTRRTA